MGWEDIFGDDDQIVADDTRLWLEEAEREKARREESERLIFGPDDCGVSSCADFEAPLLNGQSYAPPHSGGSGRGNVSAGRPVNASGYNAVKREPAKPAEAVAPSERSFTYSQYLTFRKNYRQRNVCLALLAVCFCAALIISLLKPEANGWKFLEVTLFIAACIAFAVYKWAFASSKAEFESAEISFEKYASTEEKAKRARDEELHETAAKRLATVILLIILAAVLLSIAFGISNCVKEQKHADKQQALMNDALTMLYEGRYDDARNYLDTVCDQGFPGVRELAEVCYVHSCYDRGDLEGAYGFVTDRVLYNRLDLLPQSEKEFCERVKKEYSQSRSISASQYSSSNSSSASSGNTSHAMPYIGMWEGYVNKTQLGEAGSVKTKRYNTNRISHVETIYKFYKDRKIVYIVKCLDGYVSEITDKRGSAEGFPSGSSSGSLVPSPDIKYFSDPEDFYDYYYDDFLDYEEAEDYYYSHGGF